jgi:hypothetical protein
MKQIYIIITILFTTLVLSASAQDDNDAKGGRIEALKIAFLTKKLDLSPSEAQKFWPVYNNYAADMRSARIDQRQHKSSELDTEDKILNIRKKYSAEFSKAISTEKVNTFFRSEKEFGTYVRKELMERQEMRQGVRPGK